MKTEINVHINDDGGILHTVEQSDKTKRLSGKMSVYATIEIDGQWYQAKRDVVVSFKKIETI